MNRFARRAIYVVAGVVRASISVTAQTTPRRKEKSSAAGSTNISAESKANSSLDAAIHAMFSTQRRKSPNSVMVFRPAPELTQPTQHFFHSERSLLDGNCRYPLVVLRERFDLLLGPGVFGMEFVDLAVVG